MSLPAAGVEIPAIHPSTFESVSLAAAHAHFQATGSPAALFVHVDAGTENLGAMVHDVFRDRAGVVVIAGLTPYEEHESSPGGRNRHIQWLQDVPDQAGVVRPYARACIEITRPEMLDRAIGRAVQLASGYPAGLVYLTVSRDVLMDRPFETTEPPQGFAVPVPPAMPKASVDELADLLARASRPLLVTSRLGRREEGFSSTVRLAELLGMPVVRGADLGPVSIPTLHPLHIRDPRKKARAIAEADVILLAECDVPWVPKTVRPSHDATVVHVDPDPNKAAMPMWSFPTQRSVQADGPTAIAQLVEALEGIAKAAPELASGWARRAGAASPEPAPLFAPGDDLTPLDVFAALNEVLEEDDVIVEEAVTAAELFYSSVVRQRPGTVHGAFSPGLGWALGGAVGVKLAKPEARVVAVLGDGAFLFGVPTSAFSLSAELAAPFLAVILDNGGYRASRMPVYDLFPEGYSVNARDAVGTRFAHAPDYAALAQACGAHGERVSKGGDLVPALRRGLAHVGDGVAAVLDVVVKES